MPDLSQLPVPLYTADMPYHWEYDNLPLQTLSERDYLINSQVDIQGDILNDAAGSEGTLAVRLDQSLNPDGTLITAAVDLSFHNIAEHNDGTITLDNTDLTNYIALGFPELVNPVQFVRMLQAERDKLALIANEATDITFSFETISNIVFFDQGQIQFAQSDSIEWQVTAPNTVQAVLTISTDFAHRHYYDMTPIMVPTSTVIPVDYQLFMVTSSSTPFIEGSLRVYINGVRISSVFSVYYPSNPVSTWTLNSFAPDCLNGTFTLENPITESDIIQIDFDVSLT